MLKKLSDSCAASIARHPARHCAGYWLIILGCAVLVFQLQYLSFDDISFNDFIVTSQQDSQNYLALKEAQAMIDDFGDDTAVSLAPRSKVSFLFSMSFLFYSRDGSSLLTAENLQAICECETLLTSIADFKHVCATSDPRGKNTSCDNQGLFFSALFYGSNATEQDCVLLAQSDVDARVDALFKPSLVISDTGRNVRSQVFLAGPLGADSEPLRKTFNASSDDFDGEQAEVYKALYAKYEKALFDKYDLADSFLRSGYAVGKVQLNEHVEFRVWGLGYDFVHFRKVVNGDQMFSGGSFLMVAILMYVHVGSALVAFLSMMSILFSIVVGLLFYKGLFGIMYFTNIHVVIIFIILGIGADNVFVLVDAYKQAFSLPLPSSADQTEARVKRMQYAYWRAGASVTNTAVTTCIAFTATGVSPIKPIAAFGFFAAIVILVNLSFMFTLHPANILLAEILSSNSKQVSPQSKDTQRQLPRDSESRPARAYIQLLDNKAYAVCLSATSVALGLFMLLQAAKLQTPSQQESNFKEGHMFTGFQDDFNGLFQGGSDEEFVLMEMVFGIKELNQEGVERFAPTVPDKPQFVGTPVFNPYFEVFTGASQNYLINLCSDLRNKPTLILNHTVICVLEDFQQWHYIVFNSSTLGLDSTTFTARLQAFAESPAGQRHSRSIGIVDGNLLFMVVNYRATFKMNLPLLVKQPFLKNYEDFSTELQTSSETPMGMREVFQTSFDTVWQHSEQGMVDGLFSGMQISCLATFGVLMIGTQSLTVSIFALSGVVFIVCCVLGLAFLIGWSLGTSEAIAGVMVIGLSVDYVLHLGHMLRVCQHESSEAVSNKVMVHFAVHKMGGTVVAGAMTTGASSAFLFMCQMAFFNKMAVLISATVVFSVTYAFLFFLPICRILGPGTKQE